MVEGMDASVSQNPSHSGLPRRWVGLVVSKVIVAEPSGSRFTVTARSRQNTSAGDYGDDVRLAQKAGAEDDDKCCRWRLDRRRLTVPYLGRELLNEFGEFRSVGDTQSGAGSVDVSFDRANGHGEGVGDVFVGQAVSDEGGDFAFSVA